MLSAKKLAAGKRGQIEAKINTSSLTGPVEKRIMIKSNDPRSAEVALTIKAVIEPEIGVSDFQIVFDSVPMAKEVVKEIVLTVREGKSIKILSAASRNPDVMAKLDPARGGNGKKWKLIAVHKANAKLGYFFGQIVVKTDSRLTPELSIYVRGEVTAAKR